MNQIRITELYRVYIYELSVYFFYISPPVVQVFLACGLLVLLSSTILFSFSLCKNHLYCLKFNIIWTIFIIFLEQLRVIVISSQCYMVQPMFGSYITQNDIHFESIWLLQFDCRIKQILHVTLLFRVSIMRFNHHIVIIWSRCYSYTVICSQCYLVWSSF